MHLIEYRLAGSAAARPEEGKAYPCHRGLKDGVALPRIAIPGLRVSTSGRGLVLRVSLSSVKGEERCVEWEAEEEATRWSESSATSSGTIIHEATSHAIIVHTPASVSLEDG